MLLWNKACDVFADYHQFYLWDSGMSPVAPDDYSGDDVRRRIKAGVNVVVVMPVRNATVPVEVEVHDADPGFDPAAWDHAAEASLHLPTGQLQVHECTGGPVADVGVSPGWYRVRSLSGGLATAAAADSAGDGDYYRVVLWPAPPEDVRVLKAWAEPGSA